MDYEKKYKTALERAKKELNACGSQDCDAARQIFRLFPELAESEDEKIISTIRKALEAKVEDLGNDVTKTECLAWLERQSEQKSKKVSLWKHWKDGIAGGSEGEQIFLIKNGNTYSISSCLGFECDYIELSELDKLLEKQGKTSPTLSNFLSIGKNEDKIEPKFHEGDWITDGNITIQIEAIKNDCYLYCGDCALYNTKTADKVYHLWAIADAKDGDVLKEDSCIFIIQKLGDNNTAAETYCTLYDDGDFDNGSILYFDIDSTKPATKEQRDLLFQKMHEAGYEWDAEKKELRKIHVIDEGKAEMDYCFTKMMNGEKVSPTWSEEDERILNGLISSLVRIGANTRTDSTSINYTFPREINWLKSLKQKYTWKPSDEQMHYLSWIANIKLGDSVVEQEVSKHLNELLEDLKKLKG